MSELPKPAAIETGLLLSQYNFDLGGWAVARLVDRWLQDYPSVWLRQAAIEALYQGRYKAISVEQILAAWQRRGRALPHFSSDFERMICSKLPALPTVETEPEPPLKLLPAADNPCDRHPIDAATPADTIAPYHPPATDSVKLARLSAARLLVIVDRLAQQPIDRFVPDPTPPDFYAKLRSVAQQPLPSGNEEAAS